MVQSVVFSASLGSAAALQLLHSDTVLSQMRLNLAFFFMCSSGKRNNTQQLCHMVHHT